MLFFKKAKLERQLMNEIKSLAGVDEFPYNDAKTIAKLLVAYNRGKVYVNLVMISAIDVLEKYPNLCDNWDNTMIKYKKTWAFS